MRDDVQSEGEQVSCFMVATRFRVTDPFGEEVANARLVRREDACSEMKPGMIREDHVYFPESLLSQLSQLADYLGTRSDASFIRSSVTDQPGAVEAMSAVRSSMFGAN